MRGSVPPPAPVVQNTRHSGNGDGAQDQPDHESGSTSSSSRSSSGNSTSSSDSSTTSSSTSSSSSSSSTSESESGSEDDFAPNQARPVGWLYRRDPIVDPVTGLSHFRGDSLGPSAVVHALLRSPNQPLSTEERRQVIDQAEQRGLFISRAMPRFEFAGCIAVVDKTALGAPDDVYVSCVGGPRQQSLLRSKYNSRLQLITKTFRHVSSLTTCARAAANRRKHGPAWRCGVCRFCRDDRSTAVAYTRRITTVVEKDTDAPSPQHPLAIIECFGDLAGVVAQPHGSRKHGVMVHTPSFPSTRRRMEALAGHARPHAIAAQLNAVAEGTILRASQACCQQGHVQPLLPSSPQTHAHWSATLEQVVGLVLWLTEVRTRSLKPSMR